MADAGTSVDGRNGRKESENDNILTTSLGMD